MEHIDVSSLAGGTTRLNIVHVIVGLNVGGAELMLSRLIESHAQHKNCRHTVISLTDLGVIGRRLQRHGIDVKCINMGSGLSFPIALFKLCLAFHRLKPDIVQTWMYHADLLGGIAARIMRYKNVVWGVRTTDIGQGGKRATLLIRKVCALLSTVVPRVIVCAAEASKAAHVAIGYEPSRMQVIPNGFDLSRLRYESAQRESVRAQHDIRPDQIVIGSLGRFNPVKDHANFIAAAASIAESNPTVMFLLVGRDLDAQNVILIELIRQTGYAERFVLLGERPDVPACLSAMDIFCLHSRTEGFPNVLGEAMAMGLPCVTTDVGDASYLLNGNGIVVPPNDAPSLADGLRRMLNYDSAHRRMLGQSGARRIRDAFTMEHASRKFLLLYEHLLVK